MHTTAAAKTKKPNLAFQNVERKEDQKTKFCN